jgi:hypothetical protein
MDRRDRAADGDERETAAPPTRRRATAAVVGGLLASPSLLHAQVGPAEPSSPRRPLDTRLTTKVRLNGRGPFLFRVATEADRTLISAEAAAQLKLPEAGQVLAEDVAGSALRPAVDVDELRVGWLLRLPLKGVPLAPRADLGADGVIGLDVLQDRVVTSDFAARSLQVDFQRRSPQSFSIFPSVRMAGALPDNHIAKTPLANVLRGRQLGGRLTFTGWADPKIPLAFVIAAGADRSVGNAALRAAIGLGQDAPSEPFVLHGLMGGQARAAVATVPQLRVGGVGFERMNLAFADLPAFERWGLAGVPALLLGLDLLSSFGRVTIDFGRGEAEFLRD